MGVVLSTAFSGGSLLEQATRDLGARGPRRISPFLAPNALPSSIACQVALATGAKGPVLTPVLACAGGAHALLEAVHILRRGEATAVVAGGAEASLTRLVVGALSRTGATSRRNDDPRGACRPFDLDRDGFVCGEGAAVMVLERAADARARGAAIYAEVAGGALTSSAHHITNPEPDGDGMRRALIRALDTTGTRPHDVDVVFANGLGSVLGDAAETSALKATFGAHAHRLKVPAIKSAIGNTLGAAGAMSALSAALSIRTGWIPPTINLQTPDPACDLDYVPLEACLMPVRTAVVNASGFGGLNVALVLRAPE
jgi:3-oxoacyl-[acyl-carrier-protein] synthase II